MGGNAQDGMVARGGLNAIFLGVTGGGKDDEGSKGGIKKTQSGERRSKALLLPKVSVKYLEDV